MQGLFDTCKSINVIHYTNKRKITNHIIINRFREKKKTFEKIQHPFMIKNSHQSWYGGTYVNIIKSIMKTRHTQQWKAESSSPKLRTQTRMLTISTLFNVVLEVLTTAIRQDIKLIQIRREEIKLSLFADNMILYIENPKVSIQTLLEQMNSVKVYIIKLIYRNLLISIH